MSPWNCVFFNRVFQVFGTPPPQTLFHTRQAPSPLPHSQPSSPIVSALACNLNQSAYKGKSPRRPQPSESMRCLLPHPNTDASSLLSDYQQTLAQTSVYLNYHHSLNSLVHIIDRVCIIFFLTDRTIFADLLSLG